MRGVGGAGTLAASVAVVVVSVSTISAASVVVGIDIAAMVADVVVVVMVSTMGGQQTNSACFANAQFASVASIVETAILTVPQV